MYCLEQPKTIIVIALLSLLSACTTIPQDKGIRKIQTVIQNHSAIDLSQIDLSSSLISDEAMLLLQNPLSIADAERLSIQTNPLIRVRLGDVGIAEADYAQAGRMENPGLSYERFSKEDNSASLLFDIGGLLLMPLKRQMEARRLQSARYNAATDVLEHIALTRQAWINAVTEKQQTALIIRAVESAETSNQLTRQMTALGHSSVIDAARSELLLGEMRSALVRQRLIEGAARETLIRHLGLWGELARNLQVPDRLPALPKQPISIPAVEQQAIEGRLDVQMARLNLEGMAKNLKLTRLNPFISAIEFGPVREEADGDSERGYEIELRLPIFDAGGIKTEKARILFSQAQARAEATAIAAASAARQALSAYQGTWEVAHHMQTQMAPLRQRISSEQLLRYNGMLISVFDLLTDLQSATAMEAEMVNAMRDFWLADTNLQSVLTGVDAIAMGFSGSTASTANDSTETH